MCLISRKIYIIYILFRYCNQRIVVFDIKGRYLTEIKGDWTIVHSIVLFEEEVKLFIILTEYIQEIKP